MIHGANLVEHHVTGLPLEPTGNSSGIRLPPCAHRRDDHRADPVIHLIGGHHQTGTRFLDLPPERRVEPHQVDLETVYCHSHSSSSQRVGTGPSSKASSPRWAISANAASHPARGFAVDWMTSEPSRTLISTSSPRPLCSSSGLGMRIPRELPMRKMRVFMHGHLRAYNVATIPVL